MIVNYFLSYFFKNQLIASLILYLEAKEKSNRK